MKYPGACFSLLAAILLSCPVASAQHRDSGQMWLTGSLGVNNPASVSAILGASYHIRPRNLVSGRMLRSDSIDFFAPSTEVTEFALMYGWTRVGMYSGVSFSTGIAYASGWRPGDERRESLFFGPYYVPVEFSSIGIPIDIQLRAIPSRYVGIGLHFFGHINREHSFSGIAVSLQIGLLR